MASWMATYDGIFFITILTILTGFCGLAIKHCLKSKCENLNICCGLIKIERRVDLEVEEEMKQMELGERLEEEKMEHSPKPSPVLRQPSTTKI